MKRAIFLPLLCLALAVMAQPRQEIYLEKGWRFTRGDISGAADPADRAGAGAPQRHRSGQLPAGAAALGAAGGP